MSLNVVQQFIKYVKIHTTSKQGENQVPSTSIQFDLAKLLEKELLDLGFTNVEVYENCFVIGTLDSNISNKKFPTVCFFAHMDTSPDESGKNVQPRIITSYDGSIITYPNNPNLFLSPEDTPILKNYINSDIIVTDGTTLLGADDKAGIAEIMTAMSKIITSKKPHGPIKVVFTPDEEVGTGIEIFDVKQLQADFGYTLDGDELGAFEYENFNAAGGIITIKGYNVHPDQLRIK
jgi:tripeptide aminopeptidase